MLLRMILKCWRWIYWSRCPLMPLCSLKMEPRGSRRTVLSDMQPIYVHPFANLHHLFDYSPSPWFILLRDDWECSQLQIISTQATRTLYQLQKLTKMLRALDLDPEDHPFSAAYKRNKFVVSIRRENRSKMFTSMRKMQDTREEREEEGVVAKEYKEDVARFNSKGVKEEDFEALEKMMDSEELLKVLEGIIGIRKLVDLHNFAIDKHVKAQTIDKLLCFLQHPHLQVKYQATCIFASIASIYTPLNAYITSCKPIPAFIPLLKINDEFIYQTLWFFSNMVIDCTIFRNQLINQGVADLLINLLQKTTVNKIETVVALTMANMCRGDPLPQYNAVKGLMVSLCFALAEGRICDSQQFCECLWGISYHVNVSNPEIDKVIESNICIKCIQILNTEEYHQNDSLILPSIRVVSRLSQGGVKVAQYLLDNNALEALQKMLYHESAIIRRQASLSLSNIAASNFQHVNLLLQNDCLINRLRQMMERDEIHVKYEIAIFFCNMCAQKELDIDVLIIQLEIVECFQDLLTSNHEEKVVAFLKMLDMPLGLSQRKVKDQGQQSLLALEMQRKGILAILQQLQYHQNQKIYNAASEVLHRYFHSFMEDPLANGPFSSRPRALKSI